MTKTTWIAATCGVVFLSGSVLHAQTAPWRHEMKLVDYMGIYDFPEELISFPFTCPAQCGAERALEAPARGG